MANRSSLTWPGAQTAWPNVPTGTGQVVLNAQLAARTGANGVKSQEIPMGMDQSQPLTEVFQTNQSGNRCSSTTPYSPVINVPFNQQLLVPSSGDNYPNCFLGASTDGAGNTRYEGGYFAHCTNGGAVGAGHFGSRGTIIDNAVGGGSGGSGMSTLYGTIRYGEFTHGTDGSTATVSGFTFPCIRHCLRIDLRTVDLSSTSLSGVANAGLGYTWPANKADGGFNVPGNSNYYSGPVPQVVNGALLVIPRTVNLNTMGLTTQPGKQLAWTFQNFGARCCNTQHNSTWAIATEWSVSTSGAQQRVAVAPPLTDTNSEFFNLYGFPMYAGPGSAFFADMNRIITALYVVTNDSSTNIGGGGTPLTYGAPPFGASISAPFVQQVNGQTASASPTLTVANAKTQIGSVLSLLVGARAPGLTLPARVQNFASAAQTGITNTTAVAPSSGTVTVTTGNYLLASPQYRTGTGVTGLGATPFSSTGTASLSSWTKLAAVQDTLSPSQTDLEVWIAKVNTGGTCAITVTYGSTGAGGLIVEEVSNLSGSLDITAVTGNGTGVGSGAISLGPSAATVTGNDYVFAAYGSTGTPLLAAEAFSPVGTSLGTNPITNIQQTGADNNIVEISDQLEATAGTTQSFSASSSGGHWLGILLCLAPATIGSAPTLTVSGGGTWTQRFSVTSPSGLGTCAAFDLNPTGQVAANGITITSSSSVGSIEYEFYEIATALFQAQTSATGTSTAPTVSLTPTATTDVQVGIVFVPNSTAANTPTSVTTWTNDTVTVGVATNANSQIVSGGNVAASTSSQTYSSVITSSPWVAGILNYSQDGAPSQIAQPTIAAGQAQVAVNFVTPNNNGSSLTSYVALVYSGVNADGSGGSLANTITGIAVLDYSITPYVISGLTSNGPRYSVAMEAVNGVGTSAPSARSLGVIPTQPTTVPGTPLAPTVVAGDTIATVTITPPSSGGVPITAYTFNCYNPYPSLVLTQTQASNVFTFSGLTDGNQYGFTGIAINGNGPSLESPVTLATPNFAVLVSKTVLAGSKQPTPFKPF